MTVVPALELALMGSHPQFKSKIINAEMIGAVINVMIIRVVLPSVMIVVLHVVRLRMFRTKLQLKHMIKLQAKTYIKLKAASSKEAEKLWYRAAHDFGTGLQALVPAMGKSVTNPLSNAYTAFFFPETLPTRDHPTPPP